MTISRFQAGRTVQFVPTPVHRDLGVFEVVREMPREGVEPRYRVKSVSDGHERVAAEHELRPILVAADRAFAPKKGGRR